MSWLQYLGWTLAVAYIWFFPCSIIRAHFAGMAENLKLVQKEYLKTGG